MIAAITQNVARTAGMLMAKKKKREPVVINWAPYLEKCACGSQLRADLVYGDRPVPLGYMCEECRDRRIKTFGVTKVTTKPPPSAAAAVVESLAESAAAVEPVEEITSAPEISGELTASERKNLWL